MSYFQERVSEETYMLCYKPVQNVSLLTIFSYNIWLYLRKVTENSTCDNCYICGTAFSLWE